MSDIDFDELDRAVTSALGETPAQETAEPTMAAPSSSISSHAVHARIMPKSDASVRRATLSRSTTPALQSELASDEPTAAPAPAQKRIIPHREGRFMDVVRPGGAARSLPASAPVQQEVSAREEPDPIAIDPSMEKTINELLTGGDQVDASPEEAQAPGAFPQPQSTVIELPVADTRTEEEGDTALASLLEAPLDTSAPAADSPFLADAKVEKRPLGTGDSAPYDTPSLSIEPAAPASESALDPLDVPVPAATNQIVEEDAPLPEELQDDLVAIESATVEAVPTAPVEEPSVAGPTSIARQYKETIKTASEDDESGAIFDPQTYQQPIEAPVKKSFHWGWLIVLVIVILIAVVVAVAAMMGGILPVPL